MLKIVIGTVASILLIWLVYEDYWFRQTIPESIELDYRVSISGEYHLLSTCGVAVYKLSKKAQTKILENGVKFFNSAKQARGHTHSYYTYGKWMKTPYWSRPEDIQYILGCSSLNKNLFDTIVSAGKNEGAFYSFKTEGFLIVFPKERLVVYAYFD